MNKKLLAAAVVGALAVPGMALAQVTISGSLNAEVQNQKHTNTAANRAGFNTSTTRIQDSVSIITFGVNEDLGGGLRAFGQYQLRPCIDAEGAAPQIQCTGATESFVGIGSNAWGQLKLGSITTSGTGPGRGGDWNGTYGSSHNSTTNLMMGHLVGVAAGALGAPAANWVNHSSGRTNNSVQWISPNWSGFSLIANYASNFGADGDLTTGIRKGRHWALVPEYTAPTWRAGVLFQDTKLDAVARDAKHWRLWGTATLAGIQGSVVLAQIKFRNPVTGVDIAKANKFLIPLLWRTGPHTIAAHYARSAKDKILVGDTKSTQIGLTYNYALSKRASVFVDYIRLNNGAAASFPITGAGGRYGEVSGLDGMFPGEDGRVIGGGMKLGF